MTSVAPGPATRHFSHGLRVRFNECDLQARVFNSHYLAYVDVALTEFLREATGDYARLREAGYDLVLAEATVRFLAPARFDEELDLRVVPSGPGRTSLRLAVHVERAGTPLAAVETRYVCVDGHSYAPTPWPEWFRRALAPYAAS